METSPPYIIDRPAQPLSGEQQRCCTCRQEKPVEDFYYQNRRLGQRQPYCKVCKAEYNRAWYAKNHEKQKADVQRNRKVRKAQLIALLAEAKSGPCQDCGRTFPPEAMDFDHVRGRKPRNVSALVYACVSDARLLAEIAKCDLVCANCHRIRTMERAKQKRRMGESVGAPGEN